MLMPLLGPHSSANLLWEIPFYDATSSHPASLIASVPYGQYLRLKRNWSENAQFEQEAKALQICLKQRGYSNKCLKNAYLKAKYQDRSNLIHGHKVSKVYTGVRTIRRFSGQHQQMRDIMQKYWYLLMGDASVSKHLKNILRYLIKNRDH